MSHYRRSHCARRARALKPTRILSIEPLEDRRLLAQIVGVDFDADGATIPLNWNQVNYNGGPVTVANLIQEDGATSSFSLSLDSAMATEIDTRASVNSIVASTIPDPTSSLSLTEGFLLLDGNNATLTATFGGLNPMLPYEVYVFGLEAGDDNFLGSQQVSLFGEQTIAPFVQGPLVDDQLWINGQVGVSGTPLGNFATTIQASDMGNVRIEIEATDGGIALGALAIRPVDPSFEVNSPLDNINFQDNVTTLREAILFANATPGTDTITFASNMSGQVITLDGTELEITDAVSIGAIALDEPVIIDGDLRSRIFHFSAGAGSLSLDNLTLRKGQTGTNNQLDDRHAGGAIRFMSSGSLTLTGSKVENSHTRVAYASGGGIYTISGSVTLLSSEVSGNSTNGMNANGGGISTDSGNVTLISSTISGNRTLRNNSNGGGIRTNSGSVTFVSGNSSVTDNYTSGADSRGGGISTTSGPVSFSTGGSVTNNRNLGNAAAGGGIFTQSGDITATSATISGNYTTDAQSPGGGIFTSGGKVSLTASSVTNNRTEGNASNGGGIHTFSGDITLTGSTLSDNSTEGDNSGGGGLYSSTGDVNLNSATVTNNITAGSGSPGGGILASSGDAMIFASKIKGNRTTNADSNGGGAFFGGKTTIELSTISGNSTEGFLSTGGGILAAGDLILTRSTVSGNRTLGSQAQGGGIDVPGATLTLNNSTLSGNKTLGPVASGGGINSFDGKVNLNYSTVAGNSTSGAGSYGGGVNIAADFEVAELNINSSIVAKNSVLPGNEGPDISFASLGVTPTADYSLIGDSTDSSIDELTGIDNLLDLDPLIGPLGNNGGGTQTHAILPGSPLLDAGRPLLAEGVIDNYAFEQFSYAYNFVDIFSNANNAPQVAGGVANLNVGEGTGAFIWNRGQSLRSVGDRVSIDFGFNYPIATNGFNGDSSAGLAIFSSPTGGDLTELRVETPKSAAAGSSLKVGNLDTIIAGSPTGSYTLELEVENTTPTSLEIAYTLRAAGASDIVGAFTYNAPEAFFGPVAFDVSGAETFHDNLTFNTIDPPPTTDQRGLDRAAFGKEGYRTDIGAYESQGEPQSFPAGDYNQDGIASIADYTVWRDSLGASVAIGSGADGVRDGVIDAQDYDFWKQNFGNTIVPVGLGGAGSLTSSPAQWFISPSESGSASSAPLSTAVTTPQQDNLQLLLALDHAYSEPPSDETPHSELEPGEEGDTEKTTETSSLDEVFATLE